jgi:hypothetical protein
MPPCLLQRLLRRSGPGPLAALPSGLVILRLAPAPAMTQVREAGPAPPACREGVDSRSPGPNVPVASRSATPTSGPTAPTRRDQAVPDDLPRHIAVAHVQNGAEQLGHTTGMQTHVRQFCCLSCRRPRRDVERRIRASKKVELRPTAVRPTLAPVPGLLMKRIPEWFDNRRPGYSNTSLYSCGCNSPLHRLPDTLFRAIVCSQITLVKGRSGDGPGEHAESPEQGGLLGRGPETMPQRTGPCDNGRSATVALSGFGSHESSPEKDVLLVPTLRAREQERDSRAERSTNL